MQRSKFIFTNIVGNSSCVYGKTGIHFVFDGIFLAIRGIFLQSIPKA